MNDKDIKKTIDNIVWWIPFKKLRNQTRELLLNHYDTINKLENELMIVKDSLKLNNENYSNLNRKINNYIKNVENKIDTLEMICINNLDKNKLKIAFDCEILFCGLTNNINRTGIYTVVYNIAKILLDKEDIDIYFYTHRTIEIELRESLIEILKNKYIQIISENSKIWSYIDIFYSPALVIPDFIINHYKHIKRYIMLHDMIPIIYPEYFPHHNKKSWFKIVLQQLVRCNNHIFSVSENTKKDFLKYNPQFNTKNITVTYLGKNDRFKSKKFEDSKNIINKYNIPQNKKYIFNLCTIEPRKNLIRVIRTFLSF